MLLCDAHLTAAEAVDVLGRADLLGFLLSLLGLFAATETLLQLIVSLRSNKQS